MPLSEQQVDQFFNRLGDKLNSIPRLQTSDKKMEVLTEVVQTLTNALRDSLNNRFDPTKYPR